MCTGRDFPRDVFAQRPVRGCQGVALVGVLWTMTLLAVIASGLTMVGRSDTRLAADQIQSRQALYVAEGGLQLALLNLLNRDANVRWLADGGVHQLNLANATVELWVQDEMGKVNLNSAPYELLVKLFTGAGVIDAKASALADAILDWRDADDLRRLNGAEEQEYLNAGIGYSVRNAPFESVEELRQVLGIEPDIYDALEPLLTVGTRRSGINPEVAPVEVLLAVSNATESEVARYVEDRRKNHALGLKPPPPPEIPRQFLSRLKGINYTILTVASMESGVKAQMLASVALDRNNRRRPVRVSLWHQVPVDVERFEQDSLGERKL
ncbi:hypothetical protein GCM10027217_46330 [Pseudomaricurvus hydrocarbonicus]